MSGMRRDAPLQYGAGQHQHNRCRTTHDGHLKTWDHRTSGGVSHLEKREQANFAERRGEIGCETHLAECRSALCPGVAKRTGVASGFRPPCREHVSRAVGGPKRIAAKNSKRRKSRGLSATSTRPLKGPLGQNVQSQTPGRLVSGLLFFCVSLSSLRPFSSPQGARSRTSQPLQEQMKFTKRVSHSHGEMGLNRLMIRHRASKSPH